MSDPTSDNHDIEPIDDRGFAAGRALRQPAPEHGLAKVRSSYRRRKIIPAVTIGVVSIVALGGVITILNQRSDTSIGNLPGDTVPIEPSTSTASDSATVTETETVTTAVPATPTPTTTTAVPATPTPTDTATGPQSSNPGSTTTAAVSPTPDPPTTVSQTPGIVGSTTTTPSGANITKQFLFWNSSYVGSWDGDTLDFYDYTSDPAPSWLTDSTVQLSNDAEAWHTAKVSICEGSPTLVPAPPKKAELSQYWYLSGSPFFATRTNDDRGLAAMNKALTAQGINPSRVESYGAPIAADGSVDRVLWYKDDAGAVGLIGSFDAETAKFSWFESSPKSPPETILGVPGNEWLDFDKDGNLESMVTLGVDVVLHEWATNDDIWTGIQSSCSGN